MKIVPPPSAAALAPALRRPIVPAPAVVLTTFQTGHGYTAAGGTANLNDTSDFIMGTQAAKNTSLGAGAQTNISLVAGTARDATARNVRIRLKVDDVTHLLGLNLFLGNSSFASNYKWIIQGGSIGSNLVTSGDWVTVTLSFHDAAVTGTPTKSALTDVRVQAIDDSTGNAVTFHVQSIELVPDGSDAFPNGVVSICFDDGYQSMYDLLKPRMDLYGFRASLFVIADQMGLASYLTPAEVAICAQCGWEVAAHAYSGSVHNTTFPSVSSGDLQADIKLMRDYLATNGFHGKDGVAYPQGRYDAASLAVLKRYYAYGRTTVSRTKETFPPGDSHRLRAISDISSFSGGYSAATLTTATTGDLDKVVANKSWLILTFHKGTSGAPAATTEVSVTDFNSIIDAIKAKGMKCLPIGDVMRHVETSLS